MPARTVIFLDYQNVYMAAREAFHSWDAPGQSGQVDPLGLGDLLTSRSKFAQDLDHVRVYRGQPDSERDPRGYAANDRQCQAWAQGDRVEVITRTLQYPRNWPAEKAREKGIDVALAIDLVAMAVRNEYEVAILMSADTDLKPALEFVGDLEGQPYPDARSRHGLLPSAIHAD